MSHIDLNGLRVLNPRPQHQAADLTRMIQTAGGVAVEFPTLDIENLPIEWITTLPPLLNSQTAIFVSVNAVTAFFAGLQGAKLEWPALIQTIAIGKGTANALAQQGITRIQTPAIADSEHLLALPALQNIQGQTIILISGAKSRPLLETTLNQRGADLCKVVVYRRKSPKKNLQFTHALWHDDAVDIILMLSQEAIDNLFVLFEDDARTWLTSKPWIVISPRLVDIAQTYHVRTVILSPYNEILTTLMRLSHEHGRNTR